MHRLLFASLLLTGALTTGCHVTVVDNPCGFPAAGTYQGNYPLYHVQPGGSSALGAGDIGFLVTANGAGGFRLAWTDTASTTACFNGYITTNSGLDTNQTISSLPQSHVQYTSGTSQLAFYSQPGSNVDYIDFVPNADPAYIDAFIDGSYAGVQIVFPNTQQGGTLTTVQSPAAFSSP